MNGNREKSNYNFDQISRKGHIKVGIVSRHVYRQSVWSALVKGWVQHLDRSKYELYIFYLGNKKDEETKLAESLVTAFIENKNSLAQWSEAILEQNLDALIYPEIGMDPMTCQLANLRLAPTQIASWGHPETTGLPTMDYYLSAQGFEDAYSDQYYTEKLINLPNLGCCYHHDGVVPDIQSVDKLSLDTSMPILLCPGVAFKYAPQNDWVLIEIARRLGPCQLVFFDNTSDPNASTILMDRLNKVFRRAGLDFHNFVQLVPWLNKQTFHGLMQRADVYLDTIGFSGFNTAMQAVECSLPIVSLKGLFMRGRLASAILERINLSELVASSEENYISLVVKLVQDKAYQSLIKIKIQESRHLLFDDMEPIRALEKVLDGVCRISNNH